jgi:polyisoprenoid-binding protein YceI
MTATPSPAIGSQATTPDRPPAGRYTVDPVHTFVLFFARHLIVGRVVGRARLIDATVTITEDPATWSASASIDATSINTDCAKRDEDLHGPDFFDVDRFPTITFEGHGAKRTRKHWVMDGRLSVRGVSSPVALNLEFRGTNNANALRAGFHATATLRRADYGMKRDLITEIGLSTAPDVTIDIEAEATLDE